MKTNVLAIFFLLFFVTIKAQTPISSNETISVTTGYIDNLSMAWNVNGTDPSKPLIVKYTIGTEYLYDFVKIYSIENVNGSETAILLASLSGMQSGSISSVIPSGKVRITFTSDGSYSYINNPSFCSGIQISFSTDTSYPSSPFANSYISGNSITNGNVGIGVLNPSYKLEVNGTAKFFEGIQCAKTISFADNAIFNVTKAIIPDLRSTSFLMPQYGVAAPGAGGSADFWISGNNNIRMFTAGNPTPKFSILNNGNVGIGTSTPQTTLDIAGNMKITSNVSSGFINLVTTAGNPKIISNAGLFLTSTNSVNDFYGAGSRVAISQVNEATGIGIVNIVNGQVGIGLANPDKMLTVNGTIHAKEIIVDVNIPLADYVFHPNYELMPLHKVEAFVKTNRHLPEIPSAAEVKENGLNMGEMQNKLLQKIEELTLYMIDLQKVIELQSARIQILESKVKQ